ncbi:MAG: phenylalanine--tRNA ligase subunit alpha, partial [Gemmatimonadota bacterium]|nr:phenylalanine--tRNA ligase subunit alpha [Gemmatimonadota bacterium]
MKLVETLERQALTEISLAEGTSALEELRVKYIGKNGQMKQLLRSVGSLSPEERPLFGQRVNRANAAVTEALKARQQDMQTAKGTTQ